MGECQSRESDRLEQFNVPLVDIEAALPRSAAERLACAKTLVREGRWLDLLPLPPPVCLALLCGAFAGACLGFVGFLLVFLVLSAMTPILYAKLMAFLAHKIKTYIEEVDRDYIGVDVHIKSVDLSLCYGRAVIHDFVVDNPLEGGFTNEYLFKANRLIIDVDVGELLKSRGKHILIEEFELNGIDAIIEYKSIVFGQGKSNLQTVLDFIHERKRKKAAIAAIPSNETENEKKAGQSDREITLQKVEFVDVGAKMATKLGGTRVACTDVRYKNFQEETGHSAPTVEELLPILLKSIMKSVMLNISLLSITKH